MSGPSKPAARGVVLILASTVAYGSMAILAKIAFAGGVRPLGLLAFRFLLAGLLFTLTIPKAASPLPWPIRFRLWGLGGIFIVNAVAYFTALERTPASLVSVLVFTYPVMVMFLSALLGLDPLTVRGLTAAVLAVAGSALAIGGTAGGASTSGVALALLAALLYACYVVIGSRLLATIPTEAVARHVVGLCALLCLPWGAWRGELVLPSTTAAWVSLVIIGSVSTFVAMRAFLAGVERIGAARASVLSTLEVFVTVGLAALFLGETVSLRQVAGAALVLAAVLLQNLGASRLGGRGRRQRDRI